MQHDMCALKLVQNQINRMNFCLPAIGFKFQNPKISGNNGATAPSLTDFELLNVKIWPFL